MADIPPETEEERRERERFERELKERERRGRDSRPPTGRPGPSQPQPPPGLLGSWEFREDPQSRRWTGDGRRNDRGAERGRRRRKKTGGVLTRRRSILRPGTVRKRN